MIFRIMPPSTTLPPAISIEENKGQLPAPYTFGSLSTILRVVLLEQRLTVWSQARRIGQDGAYARVV